MERSDLSRFELTPDDERYPQRLNDMAEPPDRIYGCGDPAVLDTMCLAVVGARRATPYGIAVSKLAGRIAAESGITVVSGGAMGCDAAAARGALDAGGRTIVVSGVGADTIYPRSSTDVFRRAREGAGAVISLVPWGTPPQRWAFPQRNHAIAALATAILVSEAGQRSGTASTAAAGIDMDREVYAAPGSLFSPESAGSNALIRDGAHIVANEVDLEMLISRDFGVLRLVRERPATPQGRVLSALIAQPMRVEELAASLGEDPLELNRMLADYEMRGVVQRLLDGRFAPTEEALLGTR